jgi:hypothetical protein
MTRFTLAFSLLTSHLSLAAGQQVADSGFIPPVGRPGWEAGKGPVALLDEAHVNFHTLDGRYYTFGRLLAGDGLVVRPLRAAFTRDALAGARLLVIANALHERNRTDWTLPTPSAFTPAEIAAVRDWVREGGSLLLIADHMPFPGAAQDLAAAFGIRMLNGFAAPPGDGSGQITFRRSDGTLPDHPITRGGSPGERIDSVVSFTGQAFSADGAAPLMVLRDSITVLLPDTAWQFSPATRRVPGAGLLQGAVLSHGRGRVAVFGEAAMFSAQRAGPNRDPMGMNAPQARQNPQFLLNVVHWLLGR